MKTGVNSLLVLCAIVVLHSPEAASAEGTQITKSQQVLSYCFLLWRASAYGKDPGRTEEAAWILARDNGYSCSKWPATNEVSRQTWSRSEPNGVVAIFHTHPAGADPRPSCGDSALAKRTGLEIYTISRKGIWKVDPSGAITLEEGPEWYKEIDPDDLPVCE